MMSVLRQLVRVDVMSTKSELGFDFTYDLSPLRHTVF